MYLFDKDLNPVRPPDMPEGMPIFGWFAPLRLVYRASRFTHPSGNYVLDFDEDTGWHVYRAPAATSIGGLCKSGTAKYEAYGVFLIHKDAYGTEYAKLWCIVGYHEDGKGWKMHTTGETDHSDWFADFFPAHALGICMVELGVMENPHIVTLS